jgi:ribonuclease HII
MQQLMNSKEKGLNTKEKEVRRFMELRQKEFSLQQLGYRAVGGVDEAGRGPLAGPVVAACVILPPNSFLPGLDDSKKLSPTKREKLAEQIKAEAVAWAVGLVNHKEIDRLNIYQATKVAMAKAVRSLKVCPDYLLLDAMHIDLDVPQESIVRGDSTCAAIAAASVIAKTYRDRLMVLLDEFYPVYGFKDNKGYGTAQHREALQLYGPSPVHRRSFLQKILVNW